MTSIRIKLIEDWHQCWRWSSMRFLALGAALQGALQAPAYVTQYLPSWVLQATSTASFAFLILAGLGRITRVEKHDVQPSEPNHQ